MIAPLDWGLGHASRCVPLISKLSLDNDVIVGVTSLTAPLLRTYFPAATFVPLPSYGIRYSLVLPQWLAVALQVPRALRAIRREKKALAAIVRDHKIDLIISDNRYGIYHHAVPTYFITHQLRILVPFLGRLATRMHLSYLKRFREIWIPDYEDHRLSGRLTELKNSKAAGALSIRYIGPQSALSDHTPETHAGFDVLLLLSGPEAQRSLVEAELIRVLEHTKYKVVLVRGSGDVAPLAGDHGFEVHEMVSGALLRALIERSKVVICRSGYSTLMDLHVLGKKACVLIPTPGQPEQEYLAGHWAAAFDFKMVKQDEIARHFQNSFTP